MQGKFLCLGMLAVFLSGCGNSSLNSLPPAKEGLVSSLGSETEMPGQTTAAVRNADAKRQLKAIADRAEAANTAEGDRYVVGPQDVVEITVFNVSDLSKTLQVSEIGTINYPLIGETHVSGKTTRQIEQDLTRALGAKYLQNPQVSVLVREFNSRRVTLDGAVKKPGIYPLQGRMTLLQLMATAGGVSDVAEDDIIIMRKTDGQQVAARYALSELRTTDGRNKDPELQAGDVIIVNRSVAKVAFGHALQALSLTRYLTLF